MIELLENCYASTPPPTRTTSKTRNTGIIISETPIAPPTLPLTQGNAMRVGLIWFLSWGVLTANRRVSWRGTRKTLRMCRRYRSGKRMSIERNSERNSEKSEFHDASRQITSH